MTKQHQMAKYLNNVCLPNKFMASYLSPELYTIINMVGNSNYILFNLRDSLGG